MKKPRLFLIGSAAAILACAGGVGWWMRAEQVREVMAAAIPAQPELRGWAGKLRERLDEAERRSRSLSGASAGLAELSQLYHANGFLREAARCYEGLAWAEPGEARWLHLHAMILAGFGEVEPAMVLERRAVKLAPEYIPARLRLADLLLKSNRAAEAGAIYAEVLQRQADEPYARLGLARVDFEAGQWEKARQRLEPLVEQTNYQLGYDLIVTVYEQLGLNEQAARVRSQGRASGAFRDPVDPWVEELYEECFDPYRLGVAGGAAARAGDAERGLRLVARAVALAPEDVSACFQLAGLHKERKDFAQARQYFERCTVIAPEFADGWAHLSGLLAESGDAAGAARSLTEGLRKCPESPGLHLMHARSLAAGGRNAEAASSFRQSIRYRSNEAGPYVELAKVLFALDQVDEGVAALQKSLEAEPENPDALGILTFYAISTGEETAARGWLTRVRNQPRVPREQVERLLAAYRERFRRAF